MTVEVLTREPVTIESDKPRLARMSDLLDDLRADADAAHEAFTTGNLRAPITGFKALDREMGGAMGSGLHSLHASPGAGKTALALQIAASCGFPALFVSCEMAALELLRRHTARATGTYLGRLKSGEMSGEQAVKLALQAAEAAPLLALADATHAFASIGWLLEAAEVIRGDARSLLIVVDSVHSWADSSMNSEKEQQDEYTRLSNAVGGLRKLASTLDCPVLAIAERNRASMKTGGLSGGAGTRKLEYGAESLWELDRDEKDAPNASGDVEVTLKLAKNRNGSPGAKVDLLFNGALQRFREAS